MLTERILRRAGIHLPERVRYVVGGVWANTFRPHTREGRAFSRYWKRFCKSERMSRRELAALQWKKLRRLLRHAYEHVRLYRERFEEAGVTPEEIKSYGDLVRIPPLTRKDVRERLDDLIADGASRRELIPKRTSGSTGESLVLYYDATCLASARAALARWRKSIGWDGGGERSVYVGRYHFPRPRRGRPVFGHYDVVDNVLYLPGTNLTREALAEYMRKLRSFRPRFMQGPASTLYTLACHVRASGTEDVRLDACLSQADMLFPKYREVIESAFGCRVFDTYGMAERVVSAVECEARSGMHIDMEQCVVEVLDDASRQVFDETGEIVGTNLENYAMPLIRYRTGDLGQVSTRFCPCGRASWMLGNLEGRVGDLIVAPDGQTVGPAAVSSLLRSFERLRECQVVQREPDSVELSTVWERGYTGKDVRRLTETFQEAVGPSLHVNVRITDSISRTRGGKFRLVVSHLDRSRCDAADASPRGVETTGRLEH